jgi:hypothetical protein
MADISIQFHAMPEELLAFVRQIVADFDLHVVALRFRPFNAGELSERQLGGCFSVDSPCRRLHFTLKKPVFPSHRSWISATRIRTACGWTSASQIKKESGSRGSRHGRRTRRRLPFGKSSPSD